ncbi:MAG: glycine zipper 2TM domain-containing protein [Pseudomonadota bacterium]
MNASPAGIATLTAGLLATMLLTPAAFAGDRIGNGRNLEYARVVDVRPIVREVAVEYPVQDCWTEVVHHQPRRRGAPAATLAGGVIGGLVGNQFGSGRGNTAATVVGGLLGATIANDVARNNRDRDRGYSEEVRRCETVSEVRYEERVEGYDVTYRYNGRTYQTRTQNHPGDRIALRVSVTPVG